MNIARTRSQTRLEQLLGLKRPLDELEQEELYRALHADYMRQWRAKKAEQMEREGGRFVEAEARKHELALLYRARAEALL